MTHALRIAVQGAVFALLAALGLLRAKEITLQATSTIQFASVTYRVSERVSKAVLTVTRTGTVATAGKVDFQTIVNSASPDRDFIPATGTLNWAAGDGTSKQIQIDILTDNFEEEPQDFFVQLSAPTGGVLGARSMANVIIEDPSIRFEEFWTSIYSAGVDLPVVASVNMIAPERVDFLVGDVVVGTDSTPRAGDGFYTTTWTNIPRGVHTFRARAVGANGVIATSVSRTIMVIGPVNGAAMSLVHVDQSNASGIENGSIQNPFRTIQKGIDNAASNAVVKVAAGTYPETVLIENTTVQLLGSYQSDFTSRDVAGNQTTIVPIARNAGIGLFNAYTTQVDGFTISNAARGIYVLADTLQQSSLKISHNVITASGEAFRAHGGGGIHAENSHLELTDNEISHNVGGRGAGVSAGANGGSIVMRRNKIVGNIAHDDHGGGLYLMANGVIAGNRIENNEVGKSVDYGGWGGGLIVFGNSFDFAPTIVLSNNIVTGNYAGAGSAEFFDEGARATVTGELIFKNRGPEGGGVPIYVDGCCNSFLLLSNSTVADNDGGGILTDTLSSARIVNSIFWNNGPEFSPFNGSTIQISYTLADEPIASGSGINAGAGNLQSDPLFADPANNDYRLKTTRGRWSPLQASWVADAVNSPAMDAGDPAAPFSLEPIPNGGRVDLGYTGNRSEPHLSSSKNGQSIRITVRGVNAQPYVLESSSNLREWTDVATLSSNTGQLDFEPIIQTMFLFYRLRQ